MKTCTKCKKNLPLEKFSWKVKSKGLKSGVCKDCSRIYAAKHYKNNSESYKASARLHKKPLYNKGSVYIIEYLRVHPCVDCGNKDIRVLQFDHIDMVGSKARRVGDYRTSFNKLKEEINKCEVRCANCHMIRSFQQLGRERV